MLLNFIKINQNIDKTYCLFACCNCNKNGKAKMDAKKVFFLFFKSNNQMIMLIKYWGNKNINFDIIVPSLPHNLFSVKPRRNVDKVNKQILKLTT